MKLFSSSYFSKLVLFSFLISAIPVLFIGIFSYKVSSDVIQKKINTSNVQILKQSQLRVEQALKIVDNSVLQFILSQIISDASGKELNLTDFSVINDIADSLNHFDTGELKLEDAALVNLNYNWSISRYQMQSLDDNRDKEKYTRYALIPSNSFWIGDELSRLTDTQDTGNKEYCINLVRKLLPLNSTQKSNFITVKIASDQIKNLVLGSPQTSEVKILDNNYNVIMDNNISMLGKNLLTANYIQQIDNSLANSGQFNIIIDNEDTVVTFFKSEYNNWLYISSIPIKSITRESRSIGWVTFVTCLVMLLLIMIAVLMTSRKMYSPVQKLYEVVGKFLSEGMEKQPKDELKYIGERVHTLLDSQNQMEKQLNSHIEQLKEFFTIKLVQGGVGPNEIYKKFKLFNYPKTWSWFCVLVLKIDTLEETPFSETDRDLVLFSVNNVISELITTDHRLSPILYKDYQVTILGNSHETFEAFNNYVYSQAEMIREAIGGYLKVKVSIGISHSFSNLTDTPKAFIEAGEALKFKIWLSNEAVVSIDDIKTIYVEQSNFPHQINEDLLYAVKMGDMKNAEIYLHQFVTEIFKTNLDYLEYQVTIFRLFSELNGLVQDLGHPIGEVYGDNKALFDKLIDLKTPSTVELWMLKTVVSPVTALMGKHKKMQCQKISELIIEMIETEYERELTLNICAQRLHYSPNYISRVFREETGVNFSDYLAQYRLKIAKKWLTETLMKVSEISEKLQYNNTENFIRYFKKLVGMTPGQYRDKCK